MIDEYGYKMGLNDHIQNSDEKVLLARAVGKIIDKNNVKSLLDVGAGEGTFASMIAPQVETYVAVEKRPENSTALRDKGLKVIRKDFPLQTRDKFDMVLASHSIPTDKTGFEDFISSLIDNATENGIVCVITYKSEKDTWYEFMDAIMDETWDRKNYDTYETLLDIFRNYGDVTIEKIDTNVLGKNPRDLMNALRFTYAGKDAKLVDLFNEHYTEGVMWIEKHCKRGEDDGLYRFPFFQYVVTLKKDPAVREFSPDRRNDN